MNPGTSSLTVMADTHDSTTMWTLGLLLAAYSCSIVYAGTTLSISNTGTSSVCTGEKRQVTITANFDSGSNGVKIELLPSVSTTSYVLGKVVSATASGLTGMNDDWETNYIKYEATESTTKLKYYDRVEFDIGTFTGSGNIIIVYEVVLYSPGTLDNGEGAWTSAGLEYDSGSRIWIAQVMFNMEIPCVKTPSNSASATLSTETGLKLYEVNRRTVTLLLAGPVNHLVVSVIRLSGEVIPQRISLRSVGTGLDYSIETPGVYVVERFYGCQDDDRLEIDMGTWLYKEAFHTDGTYENHATVVIDIDLQTMNSLQLGEDLEYAIGITNNDNELFAINVPATSLAATVEPTVDLSDYSLTGPVDIPSGFPGHFDLNIDVPEESNLDYTVELLTDPGSNQPALSLLAVTPIFYGANMPCEIPSMYQKPEFTESIPGSGVNDRGEFKFNISNYGLIDNSSYVNVNRLTLKVTAMMLSSAVQGQVHTLSVNINSLGSKSVTTQVAAALPFDDNVAFVFSMEMDCSPQPSYYANHNFTVAINIKTEADKTTGEMTFEIPIPENLTDSNLIVYKAWVDSKGKNNLCIQVGDINLVFSKWNESSDVNDRGVGVVLMMCNSQVVSDPLEDELVIKMLIGVKDTKEINAVDNPQEQLCAGFKYSPSQIWVSCVTMTTDAAEDLGAVHEITAINYSAAPSEDVIFQWSIDRETFYTTIIKFKTNPDPLSNVREFERNILARYYRIVNTRGLCPVTHTLTSASVTSVRIFGTSEGKENLMGKLMLALDNDDTTCWTLPVRGDVGTPPFLWMEMDTDFLKIPTDNVAGFEINVNGTGLNAVLRTDAGPQFTWMTYQQSAGGQPFKKPLSQCSHTSPSSSQLAFNCPCTTTDQCSLFTLLFVYNDTLTAPYELCEISVLSPSPVY